MADFRSQRKWGPHSSSPWNKREDWPQKYFFVAPQTSLLPKNMVVPPTPARPLRPFPLIHHSWQVTKRTHPIMALMAVSKSPPQFINTRRCLCSNGWIKKEKKEGDGKDSPSFCIQPYLSPPYNSSFYSGLPLLSTSKMVAKQENSVLDPPKEYAFTAGYFSCCSFLPWTSPACQ